MVEELKQPTELDNKKLLLSLEPQLKIILLVLLMNMLFKIKVLNFYVMLEHLVYLMVQNIRFNKKVLTPNLHQQLNN